MVQVEDPLLVDADVIPGLDRLQRPFPNDPGKAYLGQDSIQVRKQQRLRDGAGLGLALDSSFARGAPPGVDVSRRAIGRGAEWSTLPTNIPKSAPPGTKTLMMSWALSRKVSAPARRIWRVCRLFAFGLGLAGLVDGGSGSGDLVKVTRMSRKGR